MDIETIRNMISTGEGAAFRFVFVSACHSYSMGATFASAGVPHVVCCEEGAALKDSAALQFTRHFYLSLAFGNTVKESFDQGCKAVRARHPEGEMKKFRLLPEDGNHDEPIFQGAGPLSSSSPSAIASKKGSHAVGTKALELSVQNKIQEDPGPSPPQFFLGREVDMYKVLQQLLEKQQRLVSVVGVTGVGRSSLVKALCHYINERASTMLDIEHIYFVKAKHDSRRRKRSLALMRRLLQLLVDAGKVSAPVQDPSDIETITDASCRALKNDKVLIVFDRVDLLDDAEEANEFPIALKTLLSETRNLKVLLTNRKPLGIPSITEKSYELGPLSLGNTVHLFAQLCPFLHTIAERHKLLQALANDLEQVDLLPTDPDLSPSTTKVFEFMGSGIPAQIEKAAYNVSKEMFLSMMSGAFLEEVGGGGSGTLVVDGEEVKADER
jgi:AAA ATPase domain